MQTDTWLNDYSSHPDCCPLCGQLLGGGSNRCSSCGFTAHESAHGPLAPALARQSNPRTPIPARASALHPQTVPSGSLQHAASLPAIDPLPAPTRSWQHNSPGYEAASSLASLSLLVSEAQTASPHVTRRLPPPSGYLEPTNGSESTPPFRPRTTRRLPRQTDRLEHIDEIDTAPDVLVPFARTQAELSEIAAAPGPAALHVANSSASSRALVSTVPVTPIPALPIDKMDTMPEHASIFPSALQLVPLPEREEVVDAASWTASPGSTHSLAAQLIASRSPRRAPHGFSPLDRVRWWLLRPGHMEFLLWLGGSVLLFGITFLLLLAGVLSLILPGIQTRGNFPSSATSTTHAGRVATPANPTATLASAKASATPAHPAPTRGQGNDPSTLGNALKNDASSSPLVGLTHLSPLVWLIGICYLLSMLFMGLAGILRRRHS